MNATDQITDAVIQRVLDLDGYKTATVVEIRRLLRLLQADLVRQLELHDPTGPGSIRNRQLERLLASTREVIDSTYATINKAFSGGMKALAAEEVKFGAHVLNTGIGVDLARPAVLDDAFLQYVASSVLVEGSAAADWWAGQSAGTQRRLANQIRLGLLEGEDVGSIVNRIRGTRVNSFRDGIMELGASNAEALVRTSVQTVANISRMHTYEANSDVILGIQWVATLDNRTTEICQELDGKMWKLPGLQPIGHDLVFPGPTAHWGCRSTQVPVLKPWSDLAGKKVPDMTGTKTFDGAFRSRLKQHGFNSSEIDSIVADRKSKIDGQPAANVTFPDWLKRQGK